MTTVKELKENIGIQTFFIWIAFILIGFTLLNPHYVTVKVHNTDIIDEEYRQYRAGTDFILDTLTYECIGNRDIENSLDEDKSKRCNTEKRVMCQGGFYIRFGSQGGSSCVVSYDTYETQFRMGIK